MSKAELVKAGSTPPSASADEPARRVLPARDMQELWFATLRRPWRTLALVPASDDASTLPLAKALAEVGRSYRRTPPEVFSGEGLDLEGIAELVMRIEELSLRAAQAVRSPVPTISKESENACIVALESVSRNPLGTAVAMAADCVLLCVTYGKSDLLTARRAIEQIGPERFVGTAVTRR